MIVQKNFSINYYVTVEESDEQYKKRMEQYKIEIAKQDAINHAKKLKEDMKEYEQYLKLKNKFEK